jgi:LysR family nitrogen assimilation transcriptional regulator
MEAYMDTKKLFYFTQLADYGSIGRTAEILKISQPALSRHVASLEKEFGHQLLTRSQHGIALTPAGESLYRSSQMILRMERGTLRQMGRIGAGPSGLVSLGLGAYNCANDIASSVLETVLSDYPGISVHCVEALSTTFSQAVKMGVLDAAIIYDPGFIPGIHCEVISTEDLYVVARRDLRVTEPGTNSISLEAMGGLELFLPESDNILRQIVESAFRKHNLELFIRAEIESPLVLRQVVEKGLGCTCLPQSSAEEIFPGREFQKLRIESPALIASFALCTPDTQFRSSAADVVVELIRNAVDKQRGTGRNAKSRKTSEATHKR